MPRPPPSIIAGPLMPMLLASVAMITSAQPSSAALPAKQRPCTMPTTGTLPDSAANWLKVWLFRPATMGMSVSPGRPPPPSANSTTGSQLVRDAQHAVGLVVVAHALGAGQHRVVVGHARRSAISRPELLGVDAADAGHHAVGRRVGDQVVERAAARLRGDRERAVFDEVAADRTSRKVDVLARGAAALRVALGDRVRRGWRRA